MHYQDTFWSSDYHSGVKALLSVLENGLNEGKASLAYFTDYTDIIELEGFKFSQLAITQQQHLGSLESSAESSNVPSRTLAQFSGDDQFVTLGEIGKKHAEYGKQVGLSHQNIVSKVQSEVVIELEDFLEDYKELHDDTRRQSQHLLNIYHKSVQGSKALKDKVEAKRRELDETVGTAKILHAEHTAPERIIQDDTEHLSQKSDSTSQVPKKNDTTAIDEEEDEGFEFPLTIGEIRIETVEGLKDVLNDLVGEIPVKRRMIPIPGINNEYFKGQDFSSWVRSRFPKQSTRRQIEKFGQGLINLGLMSNWNKLAQNVFLSDSGYYEFTDLTRYTARFKKGEGQHEPTLAEQYKPLINVTAPNSKEVWNGLKNKFVTHKDRYILQEELRTLESKYFQSIINILEQKTELESSILKFTKKAEIFDTNRIEMLYKLHSKFDTIIIEQATQNLQQLKINASQVKYDDKLSKYSLLKNIIESQGGWYWPNIDTKLVGLHSLSRSTNIFETDLVNQTLNEESRDPKLTSVPLFFGTVIEKLSEEANLKDSFKSKIDIIKASKIKKLLLQNNFEDTNLEKPVNERILDTIEELFENFEARDIVNFLKVWLLELPDSLIPFAIYDSLLHDYDTNQPIDVKIHVIGSIPRQNLASLLYLITLLAKIFPDYKELTKAEINIPFIHWIMRPPPKRTYANIEDDLILQPLVDDLFNNDFQKALYEKLESMEKYHIEKKKRAEDSLERLREARKESPHVSKTHRKTDQAQNSDNLTVDGLRQFKTTPVPSPRGTPSSSPNRSRSNSNPRSRSNLLSPTVLSRPSDNLPKRNKRDATISIDE